VELARAVTASNVNKCAYLFAMDEILVHRLSVILLHNRQKKKLIGYERQKTSRSLIRTDIGFLSEL
jgi:hypothetical protein